MIGLGNSVVKRKLGGGPPAAPVNVSQPFLVGTGEVGTVVTCNRGSWSGSPSPTYTYDFRIDSISVQNTSSNSYTPVIADNGKTLTCLVTATNPLGSASEGTSNSKIIGTAPTNTVLPTLDVTGNQVIGTVLTATDGTWTGSTPITYQYRWTRNGVAITGATTNTYTLQAADETATIRVQVRGVNSYATSAYVTSDDSVVGGYAPVNTALPSMSLSGNQLVGTVVTVTDGTWTGTPTITYQYRWLRNGSPIGGATTNSYTLQSADDGATITAEVRGVNNWGTSAYSSSNNSINAGSVPVNAVAPTVSPSGTQSTGTVITANVGTWDGTPTITYAYRWTRNGSPISGATASTYTIQVADDGTTIRCEVQGSNAFGTSAYVASSTFVSAVNAIAPVNVNPPAISGSTTLGSTLTTTDGTWTGIPTPTYSYQWKRNGSNIGGAINSTYVTTVADSSANITCDATATNAAGSATAESNTITLPSYAPVNTVAPVVSGTAVVGQTLSTTNGTWTNSPSTFSYQWRRNGVDIGGATASTYTLVSADAGANIICRVTASNGLSASADSNTVTILATLLDIQSGGVVNYSLRLIRGTYINSPSVRLRRSSDNAEVDVYFDTNFQTSLNSNINSRTSGTTLSTWVGSNSAFVVRWYDQSTNANNLTQTTPANQPILINAGILQTQSGEATISFNGTAFLQVNPAWNNIFSIYCVLKFNNTTTIQVPYRDNGANDSTAIVGYTAPNPAFYRVRTTALNISTNLMTEFGTTRRLSTLSSNSSNIGSAFVNNVSKGSLAVSGNVGTTMYVGVNGPTLSPGLIGNMQTFNIFSNTNVSSINETLNSIYNVY